MNKKPWCQDVILTSNKFVDGIQPEVAGDRRHILRTLYTNTKKVLTRSMSCLPTANSFTMIMEDAY
jgi:formaldehyde-activating enzyme involved in methanogenesis